MINKAEPGCSFKFLDKNAWIQKNKNLGFTRIELSDLYEELPAPKEGKFPFEQEIGQWMAMSVFTLTK